MDALLKPAALRTQMSGTGLITQTRRGKSLTAPAVILLQYPDKMRIEVQDPVGSTLRLLIIDGPTFWLYQNNAKVNVSGPLSALPAEFRFPFSAEDLVRVFLARPRWENFRDVLAEDGPKVGAKTSFGYEELRWDPSALTPSEWTDSFGNGRMVTARFEEFEAREGARFPTKIRLVEPAQDTSVLLVWKDWQPSVPQDKKLFQIPPTRDFGRPTKALR